MAGPGSKKCKASKTDGTPCGNWALRGMTVCRYHGGAAPAAKKAAARRLEEEKARAEAAKAVKLFGGKRDIDPSQALLDLVQWTAGEVEFWRNKVRVLAEENEAALTWGETKTEFGFERGQVKDVTTSEGGAHVAYRMLYAAQDRLAQYAAAALRAGVEERRVRLAEQQGDLVAMAIRRILAALGLSPEQEALVVEVVPRELRAVMERVA